MKSETRFVVESLIHIAKYTTDSEFREKVLTEAYECLTADDSKVLYHEEDPDEVVAKYAVTNLAPYGKTERGSVYENYLEWCGKNTFPVSRTRFYRTLKGLGYGSMRTSQYRYIFGTIKAVNENEI